MWEADKMERNEAVYYTLEKLKKAGADMAECRLADTRKTELNVDAGEISLMRTNFSTALYIKAIRNMKKGVININRAGREEIDEAVETVMKVADSSIPDEAEGISELVKNDAFHDGTEFPDRDALYDRTKEFTGELKERYPKVMLEQFIVSHDRSDSCYANTNGAEFSVSRGAYGYDCMFSASDERGTSSFNGSSVMFNDIGSRFMDMGLTRTMIADSENQIVTKSIEGKYSGTLLVSPACLEDFIGYIVQCFLGDSVIMEGTSIWKDKLAHAVADPRFHLRAEPLNPQIAGGYRTTDGYAAKDMTIIDHGKLASFVIGRYTAKKTGRERSANSGGCYVIEPGSTPLGKIIEGVDRGILLNRFSGGRPNANGTFTGVAKNSFHIEGGTLTQAAGETMISGNLAEILKNIVDISLERVNNGMGILPWIAFGDVTISGK